MYTTNSNRNQRVIPDLSRTYRVLTSFKKQWKMWKLFYNKMFYLNLIISERLLVTKSSIRDNDLTENSRLLTI